ncbi:MAG: glycosyltransferase [Acidimicrobiia bacterium]|nr:glycosyltransferase [Acidimicrobiia bacterium]
MTQPAVEEIGVVVPAHDEEARVAACLSGLRVAARHPLLAHKKVRVVVVLDRCRDRTGDTAERFGVEVIEVDHACVGSARSAGFARLLDRSAAPDERHWLVTTDADSTVPPDWLARLVAWRQRGADAVAGTVVVDDWSEQPPQTRQRFVRHQHAHGTGLAHQHVHGANLAISAAAYRRVGGIPQLPVAEDHALWAAVGAAGLRRVAAGDLPVVTSSRREGRAAGGFSDLLRSLSARPLDRDGVRLEREPARHADEVDQPGQRRAGDHPELRGRVDEPAEVDEHPDGGGIGEGHPGGVDRPRPGR